MDNLHRSVIESLESRTLLAGVPAGFVTTQIASGLDAPTAMAIAPDGRIFITEKAGDLVVVQNGQLQATPVLSLAVDSTGERGLLGIAIDPNFATDNYIYLYYTTDIPAAHNRVSRFTLSGNTVVAGSEDDLIDIDNLTTITTDNGGAMAFGPDGDLYIGTGDNGQGQAQSLSSLLGKILRIQPDGTIPNDNPFLSTTAGADRAIWAIGIQDPTALAFNSANSALYINDRGLHYESVLGGFTGANFGWPNVEGPSGDSRYTMPLFSYPFSNSEQSITGGTFYTPTTNQFPSSYVGEYFYSDLVGQWIQAFSPSSGLASQFATGIVQPVALATGSDGTLYYLDDGTESTGSTGELVAIQDAAAVKPQITTPPAPVTVLAGDSATFSVSATGAGPLSYQWQLNGANIPGANAPSYTIASTAATDNDTRYDVVVTNDISTITSRAVLLTVISSDVPTPIISSPAATRLYSAGAALSFSGRGTDPIDKTLKPAAFSWEIDYVDNGVSDTVLTLTDTRHGVYRIPNTDTSTTADYQITLTVTNAHGVSSSIVRTIQPKLSTLTLSTQVIGVATAPALSIAVDGQTEATPFSLTSVAGSLHSLDELTDQEVDDTTYVAKAWSNGTKPAHTFAMPASNRKLIAKYLVGAAANA